jgi:N-acetylmuramoyl-L-alanine amidase
MLFAVRNYVLLVTLVVAIGLFPLAARQTNQQPSQVEPPPAAPASQAEPPQQPQQAPATAPVPAPATAPPAGPTGPVIVLNPAHGGTDAGARGANGIAEKDVVLQFARTMRVELLHQGFRAVMARDDDSNPSYDDRAGTANAFRDAIFISIHVSSTGVAGTARAYYYRFSSSVTFSPTSVAPATEMQMGATGAPAQAPASAAPGFTPWAEAQKPYVDASHHLADILQGELAQRFSGSPSASAGIAIRGLQSVAAPAIAVEISSVAVSDTSSLMAMGTPLAISVSHAIQAFRPPGLAETK